MVFLTDHNAYVNAVLASIYSQPVSINQTGCLRLTDELTATAPIGEVLRWRAVEEDDIVLHSAEEQSHLQSQLTVTDNIFNSQGHIIINSFPS